MGIVYLLGAGASAASEFELPVMKGFFASPIFDEKYTNLYPYIKRYFDHIATTDINVEELITHLEISLEKSKYSDFEIHTACQKDLLNYITDRLSIPKENLCKYHEKLYEKLTTDDSVLTLNYDCVFEQSTRSAGDPQNPSDYLVRSMKLLGFNQFYTELPVVLERNEYQMGFFIKLHGSVDWLYCPNAICVNHQSFQVFPFWGEASLKKQPGEPCDTCGSPLQRVIVMPTMKKSFADYPKLGFLWEIAFRKLKDCSKLILIGTSLAVSDYYLTWLIRETSIGKEDLHVEVVNSSQDPAIRAKELTAVDKVTWHEEFRDWVTGKSNSVSI